MTTFQNDRLRRPAGLQTLTLGDTTLTYVPDGVVELVPRRWLPDTTDEVWRAHPEYLSESGNLVASIGGLLVERDGRALLIDAGLGPETITAEPDSPVGAGHGGALLDNLAKVGRAPSEIETVAITHLHPDHIGWAWHPEPGSDRPAFTGADYVLTSPEWATRDGLTEEMVDALAPRARTVTDGQEIWPGVTAMLTPGHTAGHTSYVITSGDQRLIVLGDALHCAIQVDHPDWSAAVDVDMAQSAQFRHRLVAELRKPDTLGYGIHFADAVFGRVTDTTPAWQPI
ncbi:MBL fold metallo-hydrolase [Pseudonocardia spinosispora]|uniref:MBL fold metallo-hydrolase n=1 Tax=Pseudonocardia spinosispora TaxID=103441 RepID=UPI00041F9468|nr:MBL fold metallo-hydrolase [Pseudonocardia spinosispora]